MYDLVLIKTNKEDIIAFARTLGFSNVFFINKEDIITNSKNIKNKKGLMIVEGGYEELNRIALSSKSVNILLNPETKKRETVKGINSGLNHILCDLAQKHNISIGYSLDYIQNADVFLLKKIIQNISLCKKFKVPVLIFTLAKSKSELRSAEDLESLGISLGLNTKQAKTALTKIAEYL
ncbi:MAG: RNase P subunit p30 family protein [Candidatus Nanoarchaeia archaeon]|nr:RNase P subunit p30 family protein [Candidatus Nanoarchaeia archaeon]